MEHNLFPLRAVEWKRCDVNRKDAGNLSEEKLVALKRHRTRCKVQDAGKESIQDPPLG
jgi:hypothetical protein